MARGLERNLCGPSPPFCPGLSTKHPSKVSRLLDPPVRTFALDDLNDCDRRCRAAFEYFLGQDTAYLRAFAKAYGLLFARAELDSEARECVSSLLQGVHNELAHLAELAKVMHLCTSHCYCKEACQSQHSHKDTEHACNGH